MSSEFYDKKLDEMDLSSLGDAEICRLFVEEKLDSALRLPYFKEIQKRDMKSLLKKDEPFQGWLNENEVLIYAVRNGIPLFGNVCSYLGIVACLSIWLTIAAIWSVFPDSAVASSWLIGLIFFSPWLYGLFVSNKILLTDKNLYFVRTFFGVVVFGQRSLSLTDCSIFSDTFIFFGGFQFSEKTKVHSKTFFIHSKYNVSIIDICTSVKNTAYLFEIISLFVNANGESFYKTPFYAQENSRFPAAHSSPEFNYKFDSGAIENHLESFLENDKIFAVLPVIGRKIFGRTSLERLAMAFKSIPAPCPIALMPNEKVFCLIPVSPIVSVLTGSFFSGGFWGGFLIITNKRIIYIKKMPDNILFERFFEHGQDVIFSHVSVFRFIFSQKQILTVPHFCLNLVPMIDLIPFTRQAEK